MLNGANGGHGADDLWQQAFPASEAEQGPAARGDVEAIPKAELERLRAEASNRAEEAAGLRALVERLKQEYEETVSRHRAEFDNFRKRSAREKEQIRTAAAEEIAAQLLPVLDNFDRALESTRNATDAGAIRSGVEMVAVQLHRILESYGLRPIEAQGRVFDPNYHDALSVEETGNVPDGHVSEVLVPGYTLGDKVIRPAMVKVAKAPSR